MSTLSPNINELYSVPEADDEGLKELCREALVTEVRRLRQEIRYHRDQRGHDRCWLDDVRLYSCLPEAGTTQADFRLPCRGEFLENCARYHALRQPPVVAPESVTSGD